MRVCELIPAPAYGGAETLAIELVRGLRELGHDVELCAIDSPDGPRPDEDGLISVLPPEWWGRGKRLRRLSACRRMLQMDRFDVIHAHSYLPNLYARLASVAALRNVPIVATLHSAGDDFERSLSRILESALLRKTSAVVASSDRLLDSYRAYFPGAADRTVLIPNGFKRGARPELARIGEPRRFGVVGRIARQKDIETAIRGFADFYSRLGTAELELHIIGPDSDKDYATEVRRVATEVDCPAISFRGAVPNPLSRGDIDVLIHSAIGEAAPLVLLEAAAYHVPIVCTTAALEWDWLGDNCRSFPPRDWRALSNELAETVKNWDGAISKAMAAWEIMPDIRDTITAYERVLISLVRTGALPPETHSP